MKIQCNVCEAAEANVLCCADEAALCWDCDKIVHAANKLASKHQRVPLSSSTSQMPKCDICQETVGYFFCLEDRALLCRKCDVAIHKANPLVSAHQRFLLTGVKVGLEGSEPGSSNSSEKMYSQSNDKISEPEPERESLPKRASVPLSSNGPCNKAFPVQSGMSGDFSSRNQFAGGSAMSQWQFDEFIGLGDFNQNYNFMDDGSSKADCGKLGDSADCSPTLRAADAEFDGDDCPGQVPDSFWAVPEMPSPPTASGHNWPKNYQDFLDSGVFVPDVSPSPNQSFSNYNQRSKLDNSKRRRHF